MPLRSLETYCIPALKSKCLLGSLRTEPKFFESLTSGYPIENSTTPSKMLFYVKCHDFMPFNFLANNPLCVQVIFESERGAGGDGNRIDTQLDDINFKDGKCEKCKQNLILYHDSFFILIHISC